MDSGLPNFLQLSYGRGMLRSIMNIWKQPRCPSSREWINKVIIPQQPYTGEHDALIGLSVPLTSFWNWKWNPIQTPWLGNVEELDFQLVPKFGTIAWRMEVEGREVNKCSWQKPRQCSYHLITQQKNATCGRSDPGIIFRTRELHIQQCYPNQESKQKGNAFFLAANVIPLCYIQGDSENKRLNAKNNAPN